MQEIWNKLTNGLKKYCEENGFSDVVVGLSGGIDSALTAAIAVDALGAKHVHCLMMRTKNTSSLSTQIAAEIARLNGFEYENIDIQPIIDAQKTFLSSLFGEEPKNIVLENLQARERGKILMAMSNQYNYLLLACGNKSEIAMGYCTLYGDTCGGLAPIANLYKTQVYELAKWRNKQSLVMPAEVIVRVPTAELSPNQKDQDSLPPYEILDKILALYIDNKQDEKAIIDAGFDPQTVAWVIKRYHAQAFKRKQLATALEI